MIKAEFESGTFYQGDCFDVLETLANGSLDMVLADLPYGTTQNKWDTIIPFEPMWTAYWRLLKINGACVLTASQPFTSALVMSQTSKFKYDWVWQKGKPTGHLNAKKQPLREKEDVLVFSRSQTIYNPQGTRPTNHLVKRTNRGNYGECSKTTLQTLTGYPTNIISFNSETGFHPTQKPVALFEYLIRTYTNEQMTVLDNTAGSGTTAIAAMNANRRWICIEKDPVYYERAVERIRAHELTLKKSDPQPDFA